MSNKTFGWIQDAGKLSNLKIIVKAFIDYEYMSSIDSQKLIGNSLGIGRWADETYLRLAEALGFIEYDREYDEFIISDLGKNLANSSEEEEPSFLLNAILSYPPACRILELLKKSSEPLSKFELAEKLGFTNEDGFPTFGLNNYIRAYHDATNKNQVKSNKESTLDKYARMIANYLIELGLVEKAEKRLTFGIYEAETPHTYQITAKGIQAYTKSLGKSTSVKIIKNVSYEMLASRKQVGSSILRQRRSLILEFLNKKKGKIVSDEDVSKYLIKNNSATSSLDIKEDIVKLQNLGLQIDIIGASIILKENINLNIPIFTSQSEQIKKEIIKTVDLIKSKTTLIDDAFIEKIVTESFSGKVKSKEFEDSVFQLYNESIGFEGIKLGGIGSREPDSLFWYKISGGGDGYGLIVDAKAYSKGFKINTSSARQMNDYIYNFTKKIQDDYSVDRSHYHWVTSKYMGNNDIEDFAKAVKNMYSFESFGSITSITNSLIMADKMSQYKNFEALEKILTVGREIQEIDLNHIR